MFSLQKILVLFAVLAAVWYGFKLVTRLDHARKQKLKEQARSGGGNSTPHQSSSSSADDGVVDLVQNEDGSYGASGKKDRRS